MKTFWASSKTGRLTNKNAYLLHLFLITWETADNCCQLYIMGTNGISQAVRNIKATNKKFNRISFLLFPIIPDAFEMLNEKRVRVCLSNALNLPVIDDD